MTNFRNHRRFTTTKHCYAIMDIERVLTRIQCHRVATNVHVADITTGRKYTFELMYNGVDYDAGDQDNHQYIFRFQRMGIAYQDPDNDLAFVVHTRHPSRLRKVKSVKQLCRLIDTFMEAYIEPQFQKFALGDSFVSRTHYHTEALKYIRAWRRPVLHNDLLHMDYRHGNEQESITNAWV